MLQPSATTASSTTNADPYPWIELGAKLDSGAMVRGEYVHASDGETIRKWRERHVNRDVFASIARFNEADRTSKYVSDLFFDIDAADLRVARDEALRACRLLRQRIGVEFDSLDIFFSGAKGFHLVVPRPIFGDPEGSHIIMIWSCLARRLAEHGCPHLDLTIYQTSRLWRLPNSINGKTGLCKIPIEYKELADLGLDYILDLARQPRDFDTMVVPTESPKATKWMYDALMWAKQRSRRWPRISGVNACGWRLPPCIRAIERSTLPDGVRHEAYFHFARYMATICAAPEEILDRLTEIDARHPIHDHEYLDRVARRAARYTGFRTCPRIPLARFCDPNTCWLVQRPIADKSSNCTPDNSNDRGTDGIIKT